MLHGIQFRPQSSDDYASGLFESGGWSWDTFKIIAPAETLDRTSAWQDIADQCFGASTLFARGNVSEGTKTLDHVCEKLREVVRSNTPGLLMKFWRITLYLYKPHQSFGDLKILFGFLNYFRDLVHVFYPDSRPVSRLLDALVQIRKEHLLNTLHFGYRRSIVSMETHLGDTHVAIVHMWSNYTKYWDRGGLASALLIQRYQILLDYAESQAGPIGENTITVMHGFLYAAYYNATDLGLAMELSRTLFGRVQTMLHPKERPTWSLAMQCFALAAKVLGTLYRAANKVPESCYYMEGAVLTLARGDRECWTRALMLVDLLRNWLLRWGEMGQATAWESWKERLSLAVARVEDDQ